MTSAAIAACTAPGWFAEGLLLANLEARLMAGPIADDADRWIRACAVVAGKFKRESDFAGAKRCEDIYIGIVNCLRRGLPVTTAVLP